MSVRDIILLSSSSVVPPGQIIFLSNASWPVPAGVTSICAVAVSGGESAADGSSTVASVTVNGVIVCRAQNLARIGDGGGNGGDGGAGDPDDGWAGGGGGAGGYSGNGGRGENVLGGGRTAGSGGGGGGGRCQTLGSTQGSGGGVGLYGQGANGTATGEQGGAGSGGSGMLYGGGLPGRSSPISSYNGCRGGALSYKNNIAVVPGQTVQIIITNAYAQGPGAVRIIWGPGRAFPSTNTGDM